MANRNLAIRLSVSDAAKVKATLNDVGESGQRALKKVEDASRPASKALLALDGATGTLRGTFEGMTARLGPLGGALSRLGPAGLAAGAALGALTGIIAKGVAMQGEAERSYRRLEAVLNATGHAAGLTSRQITRFAEEMERATLIQAEAVQEAAAVLATFRLIAGERSTAKKCTAPIRSKTSTARSSAGGRRFPQRCCHRLARRPAPARTEQRVGCPARRIYNDGDNRAFKGRSSHQPAGRNAMIIPA